MKGTLNLVISSTNLFCNELLQSLYTIVYCPELIFGLTLYLIQSSLHCVKQCAAL